MKKKSKCKCGTAALYPLAGACNTYATFDIHFATLTHSCLSRKANPWMRRRRKKSGNCLFTLSHEPSCNHKQFLPHTIPCCCSHNCAPHRTLMRSSLHVAFYAFACLNSSLSPSSNAWLKLELTLAADLYDVALICCFSFALFPLCYPSFCSYFLCLFQMSFVIFPCFGRTLTFCFFDSKRVHCHFTLSYFTLWLIVFVVAIILIAVRTLLLLLRSWLLWQITLGARGSILTLPS